MANRIKSMLPKLIHEDQAGFVPGRNLANNVRKAIDLITYSEVKNIEAMLVSIDFMKAFDLVDYNAMWKILEYFNFGDNIINWIKLLFKDFKLATVNAGNVSEFFTPTRGLFQGNPIASFLFVIIIEVLAINLCSNPDIDAITIKGIRYLLSQFADDMDLFMKFNSKSINAAFKTLEEFEKLSGLKVSLEKTVIYRIGSVRNSKAKFYTAKRYNGPQSQSIC